MIHDLKTLPVYFEAVLSGAKTFEIRDNADRGFQKGDTLNLCEYNPRKSLMEHLCYTGSVAEVVVSYVSNYEQKPGYVVLGIKLSADVEGFISVDDSKPEADGIFEVYSQEVGLVNAQWRQDLRRFIHPHPPSSEIKVDGVTLWKPIYKPEGGTA